MGDAARRNPDLLAAIATIGSNHSDASVRRSAYARTIELRAGQSFEKTQNGVPGDYRDSALEVVLSYNLYRSGSDKARVNQYVAKLDSAYDLRDKAYRGVWQTGEIPFNGSQRLAAQITLLSQHELSTAKARHALTNAELMQCNTAVPVTPTLDRTFTARPTSLPVEPAKPIVAPPAVIPQPAPAAVADCAQLPQAVETWLKAWNRNDVTGYLAVYSGSFVPSNAMDRSF